MKRFFPQSIFLKASTFLVLILVLAFSPCGLKQSAQKIFNVQNLSSNTTKSATSCQYVQLTQTQKSQQIAVINEGHRESVLQISEEISPLSYNKTGFRKARSVPLYILYQQLRTSLV
ncbi:hypothetical protein [Chryseobacterium sp. MP_3.2]|uniref:hypothetical protein n=1 Tax=Chryseobacterium sp. MP_3.2 TaxID=3071712 RepID=UPI002DFC0A9E|nr:hypothetical protein [Chryseobacterium sp. MP_3.2]